MDEIDRHLLGALQEDATVSHAELAKAVGLSAAGVHKRLARLKQMGVIQRTAAVLDRSKLGLDLMCFLMVNFASNMRPDNMSALKRAVEALPQVLECHTVTGTNDAILKVVVHDQAEVRDLLRALAESQDVISRVQTCLVLDEFKGGTALPVGAGASYRFRLNLAQFAGLIRPEGEGKSTCSGRWTYIRRPPVYTGIGRNTYYWVGTTNSSRFPAWVIRINCVPAALKLRTACRSWR